MTTELTIQAAQPMTLESYAKGLEIGMRVGASLLKSGLVPSHFKSAEAVVAAIWYGQEIGFTPMQSLQLIFIVNGKPSVASAGLQAIMLANGGKIEDDGTTADICKLAITRNGQTRKFAYSMNDAKKAGLAAKDNWQRMPNEMMYARAVSKGGRAMWADKIAGLYSTEELQDGIEQVEANPYKQPKKEKAKKPDIEIQSNKLDGDSDSIEGSGEIAEQNEASDSRNSQTEDLDRRDALEQFLEALNPEWENTFHYDIASLAEDKKPAAIAYLNNMGAQPYDEGKTLWFCPLEAKKLANNLIQKGA